jgi:ribose transport system permease protein
VASPRSGGSTARPRDAVTSVDSGVAEVAKRPNRLHRLRSSLITSVLVGSRYIPIWLATALLLVICEIIAPETLSSLSFSSAVLPLTAFVAVAALGQTLVIMTGGIDLSTPGVIVLVAHLLLGFSGGQNSDLAPAIIEALAVAALIGLFNGVLVAVLRFNPLIVTLAVGQILIGVTLKYRGTITNEASVPSSLGSFATKQTLGISDLFWISVLLTIIVALLLRSSRVGRRFQAVGANPRSAWIAGIPVVRYTTFAYVASALFSGATGILLAAFFRSPQIDLGDPYLLAPIAAVVLAGASLRGGLASMTSTWVAAFALTLLNQMLQVLGLSTALQYIVFGVAILVGMVISGDRIAAIIAPLLQRPGVAAAFAEAELAATGEEAVAQPVGR